ncbi:MAG: hypothetical protein BYD32DRAFT_356417, partial [Podila humilis]
SNRGTLSTIVSDLVRAAIGGDHQNVSDQDLDKYVADMIMKQASDTQSKYKAIGLDAFKPSGHTSNGLKTNKRFLSSIIKSTDDHNQSLIRAEKIQSEAAAKELLAELDRRDDERERQERIERRQRKERNAGKMRMDEVASSSGRRRRSSRSESSSRSRSRSKSRSRSRSRSKSPMDKYFQEGYDPLFDNHSDNETTQLSSKKKKKSKKEKKDK